MADGGVIIDDAGAQETRVWRFEGNLHRRRPMRELTAGNPSTIPALLLKSYALKVGAKAAGDALMANDTITIHAKNNGQQIVITVTNSSTPAVKVSASQALDEQGTLDESFVYRKNGFTISDIQINGVGVSLKPVPQHTTLILSSDS
ncbi:MAG: hypothetical protein C5B51_29285 [Terriglobia bacterium]|nr:MAG: hypothetical protein C5B51_29285 [Terriglobia bacterium]